MNKQIVRVLMTALLALSSTATARAQEQCVPPATLDESIRLLQAEMQELRSALADMRAELRQTRAELARHSPEPASPTSGQEPAPQQALHREEHELIDAKLAEQHQTKVESASKYRMRLSGIVLLNMFSNSGSVDSQDLPQLALRRGSFSSRGAFGGSLRQSQIGLEVFGPALAGARSSAHVQLDFSGGFPPIPNGVTSGLVRLRTAELRLDWERASLVAGQSEPFFSPLAPTSFASLAVPAFSYAGNLWSWIPQVRVEHRTMLGENSLLVQGGILDSLVAEPPYISYYRLPQPGESSRQPAYATRLAWSRGSGSKLMSIGVSGYYARQDWGAGRLVDGWAAMGDWTLPLGPRLAFTGEFYRGRAVGGLGGGIGRSVVFGGPLSDPATVIRGLDSVGGWAQLKVKATPKLEFNAAFGQDNPFAGDVRPFAGAPTPDPFITSSLMRNQSALVNLVYRPRTNLLFSVEDRYLRTFRADNSAESANHASVTMGVLF